MLKLCAAAVLALALAACSSSDSSEPREPTGTTADPVTVCKRAADVCRLDGSRLGVCTQAAPEAAATACEGRTPCLICMSQH